MAAKVDRDVIARALVDATLMGEEKAAEKHGLSTRTMRRYRGKLETDKQLADTVQAKRDLVDGDWADQLPTAIAAAIDFLKRAAEEANVQDPDVIHSVAGGLKILTDVTMSRRVLDARLKQQANAGVSRQDGSPGEAPREGVSAQSESRLQ